VRCGSTAVDVATLPPLSLGGLLLLLLIGAVGGDTCHDTALGVGSISYRIGRGGAAAADRDGGGPLLPQVCARPAMESGQGGAPGLNVPACWLPPDLIPHHPPVAPHAPGSFFEDGLCFGRSPQQDVHVQLLSNEGCSLC
jgi:hypothetical protein